MTTQKIHYLTTKDTNAVIKAKLKGAFPRVKFSVRASRGCATNITWDDGPPRAEVENLIGGYCCGRGLDHAGDYTVTGTNVLTEPVEKTHKGEDGKTITETVPAGATVSWGPTYIFTDRTYSEKMLNAARTKAAELLDTTEDLLTWRENYHHLDRVEDFIGDRFLHGSAAGMAVVEAVANRLADAVWRNEPSSARDAHIAAGGYDRDEELRIAHEHDNIGDHSTPQALLASVPAAAELAAEYLRREGIVAAAAAVDRAEKAAARPARAVKPLLVLEVARTVNHSPNGGPTADYDKLPVAQIIVEDPEEGRVELWKDRNVYTAEAGTAPDAVVVVIDRCMGRERIRAVPMDHYNNRRWTMAGGAYAGSHELSRMMEKDLGYLVHGMIPVHDRFEG